MDIKKSKYFGYAVVALLVLGSLFLAVKIKTELKGYNRAIPPNIISVSGEGKSFIKPDVGTVTASVFKDDKDLLVAQKKATEATNSLIAFLKAKDVAEKDIKTVYYNAGPRYDYRNGVERLRDYEVRQELQVKIRDIARAGEILAGMTAAGASKVGSLGFTVDDPEVAKSEARSLAIKDAREKAQRLSKDLGVRFKKVASYYESEGGYPGPIFYETSALGKGGDVSLPPQVPVGENEIVVRVSISYEIR